MSELVSNIATAAVGTGPVSADVYGPVRPTGGFLGFGGEIDGEGLLGLFSQGLNFASASASIFGSEAQAEAQMQDALQQARSLELQSREALIEARQEEVRGKQESNDIMNDMMRTIAAQQLASSSKGVDIGFGTPVSVTKEAEKIANLQISTARDDATLRALARRRQASAYDEQRINTLISGKRTAENTRRTGRIDALGTVAEQLQRRSRRG